MKQLLKRLRRHDCDPPRGLVFAETWNCPTCGAPWRLKEHANHSEWVREETT